MSDIERDLRRGVFYLKNEMRPLFKRGRFCGATRRLISECGAYALLWSRAENAKRARVDLATI